MATSRLIRSCFCAGAYAVLFAGCTGPGAPSASLLGPSQLPPVAGASQYVGQQESKWKLPIVNRAKAPGAQSAGTPRGAGRFFNAKPEEASHEVKDPAAIMIAYARWQEEVGNLVKARQSYENALGENPRAVDAVLGLARMDQLAGRTYEAEQRYLKAIKMSPNNADVLNAVGQFYASEERWNESKDMLNSAMLAAPNNHKHRFDLAVALASSGDLQAAMPHFIGTVGEAEAHYNIGYVLQKRGDLAGAEQHYAQAVLKKPELSQAQAMLEDVRRQQAGSVMQAGNAGPTINPKPRIPGAAHTWPVQHAAREGINAGGTQQTAYWNSEPAVMTATDTNQLPQWQHSDRYSMSINPGARKPKGWPAPTTLPAQHSATPAAPVHQPATYQPAAWSSQAPAISPEEEQLQNQMQGR